MRISDELTTTLQRRSKAIQKRIDVIPKTDDHRIEKLDKLFREYHEIESLLDPNDSNPPDVDAFILEKSYRAIFECGRLRARSFGAFGLILFTAIIMVLAGDMSSEMTVPFIGFAIRADLACSGVIFVASVFYFRYIHFTFMWLVLTDRMNKKLGLKDSLPLLLPIGYPSLDIWHLILGLREAQTDFFLTFAYRLGFFVGMFSPVALSAILVFRGDWNSGLMMALAPTGIVIFVIGVFVVELLKFTEDADSSTEALPTRAPSQRRFRGDRRRR